MALTSPALLSIRLDELKALKQGWDGQRGRPIQFEALTRARKLTSGLNIVPQADGGVTIELSDRVEIARISAAGTVSYPKATTPHREE